MKVFLAGATGAIGRPLIKSLMLAGHTAFGMLRSQSSSASLSDSGAGLCACFDDIQLDLLCRDLIVRDVFVQGLQGDHLFRGAGVFACLDHIQIVTTPNVSAELVRMGGRPPFQGGGLCACFDHIQIVTTPNVSAELVRMGGGWNRLIGTGSAPAQMVIIQTAISRLHSGKRLTAQQTAAGAIH